MRFGSVAPSTAGREKCTGIHAALERSPPAALGQPRDRLHGSHGLASMTPPGIATRASRRAFLKRVDRRSRSVGSVPFARRDGLARRFAEGRAVESQHCAKCSTSGRPAVARADRARRVPECERACVRNAMERREVLASELHARVGILRCHPRANASLACVVDDRHQRQVPDCPSPLASSASRDPAPRCR